MPVLKDAPMATSAENALPFLSTLHTLRAECVRLVEKHEHETPDRLWRPGDPQARLPKSPKAKACMKLVLNITTRNNKPEFPPRNTRLSDELVFLAIKFLKAGDRARDYPYDFNEKGDIDPARVPSGVPPIVWAHGLPFFPVYKGYYILCGREHAKWIGWLLNRKEFQLTKQFPTWSVGPVVAPASAVELTRTVDRQARVHKPSSADDVVGLWEKNPTARDVVSTSHLDFSVLPTFGNGYRLMPICWVAGYNLRCGPAWGNGRAASFVGRDIFQKDGVEVFDYEEAWKVGYVNERCAEVDPEDSDFSDFEEEEDLEMDDQDDNQDVHLDETTPAGLQDQGHHQNVQKIDAHEAQAKVLDDEQSSSDSEEHDLMLDFIRKRRQESVELGEGPAMNEMQGQAQSAASNKEDLSTELHQAMGTHITQAMPTGVDKSTTQDATANTARANLQAKLADISERAISSLKRAMAEYQASQGGDFLLPSAKRQRIFTAETDEMVSIIEGGQGRISAEIHTDDFSTIIIDRSGLRGDAAQGPVSRIERAWAEEPRTERADDFMSRPSKRPRTSAADTEDEVMSTVPQDGESIPATANAEETSTTAIPTVQGDGRQISAAAFAARNPTNTVDHPEEEDANFRGIVTSFKKRKAEWKASFPPAKKQKKTVRFDIDEVMSTAQDGGRISTEAQAEDTPTNAIDLPGQAKDKDSDSDSEDHEMMLSFLRKLRQESVEREMSTDPHETFVDALEQREEIPQGTQWIPEESMEAQTALQQADPTMVETVSAIRSTVNLGPVATRRSTRKKVSRLKIHNDGSAEYTTENEANTQSTVEAGEGDLNPKENETEPVGATPG